MNNTEPLDLVSQIKKDIAKLKDHEIVEIKVGDLRKLLK